MRTMILSDSCGFTEYTTEQATYDLSVSLDVIFHLVEDDVYHTYMNNLFGSARKYVCIYAGNQEGETILHCRTRRFTDYIESNFSDWKQIAFVPNRYTFDPQNADNTSESDFYFFQRIE